MSAISIDESNLLSTLKDLVSIESVNPSLVSNGSGEAAIARYIGERLEEIGLDVSFQWLGSNRVNVIGILRGEGDGKTLVLNGHMDTVGTAGMKIEPLKPEYRDGRVFGRGAFDMKASLAAMIAIGEAVLKSGMKLGGDLILAFVADEEYASKGSEELVKEFIADSGIVTEPTGLDVIIAHRGFAWARIDVYGRAVHGSLYNEGIDAITKSGKVLLALESLDKSFEQRHPLLDRASVHTSLIQGGIELSTYPPHCEMELERRTLPGESREHVEKELENILSEISKDDDDFKADSEVFFYRPALEIDKDEVIVEQILQSTIEVTGNRPRLVGAAWWTDASLLTDAGIPSVLFGPSGGGAHAPVEYVDFDSVVQTARVLANVVTSFCN